MRVHWASAIDQMTACGRVALENDCTRYLETDLRENQVSCKVCLRSFAKYHGDLASAMSAGTAETTQIGSGLQPASAAPKEDAR